MIIPDVNLLIYAYDELAPYHETSRKWWEDALSGPEPVGIPSIVILAFVRLTTHPALVQNPMTIIQAQEIIESWLKIDQVHLLSPTTSTIKLFFKLLSDAGTGGNLSTDAMIAALAAEYGGTVYSNDLDFDRFPRLSRCNPLLKQHK